MSVEVIRNRLNEKIPRDVIAQREGGSGKKLSYLEGHYVIARLNEVLGQGNWGYDTEEMRLVHSGEITDKFGKPAFTAHYVAKVSLSFKLIQEGEEKPGDYYYRSFSDYGYGDGSDKQNQGKAHELAVKEAVTDGLKRCAKNLGMSMGLALYDKTQENVSDESSDVALPTPASNRAPQVGPVSRAVPANREVNRPQAVPPNSPLPKKEEGSSAKANQRQELNVLINSKARVVVSQKKAGLDALKAHIAESYNQAPGEKLMDQVEKLSTEQAEQFSKYLDNVISKEGM